MATAIIYGARSGIILRVVTDVVKARLYFHLPKPGSGEEFILWFEGDIPPGQFPDIDAANAFITEKTGLVASSSRCAVVDDETGEVLQVVMADPRLVMLEGGTIIQHDEAVPGWVMGAYDLEAPPA